MDTLPKKDSYEFELPLYATVNVGHKMAIHLGNGKFVCRDPHIMFEFISPDGSCSGMSTVEMKRTEHPMDGEGRILSRSVALSRVAGS